MTFPLSSIKIFIIKVFLAKSSDYGPQIMMKVRDIKGNAGLIYTSLTPPLEGVLYKVTSLKDASSPRRSGDGSKEVWLSTVKSTKFTMIDNLLRNSYIQLGSMKMKGVGVFL